MQTIEFLITYADGQTETATVQARNPNSGFSKAVRIALQPLGNGHQRAVHSIEFAQVR